MSLRMALIGCGRIAGHHARAISLVDGAELVAVCDLIEEKARAYADQFGVACYTNYHEMLQRHPDIDTVAVITPSGMHFEHSIEIIGHYRKNLIVEKPTFLKPSQLSIAQAEAEKSRVSLFPVFQNRYNKAVQRVKRAVLSGEIGDIRIMSVRTRWCRPQRYYDLAPWRGTLSHDGGALTNQGIHHIDLLRYLGGEIESVNATMRTQGVEIEAEDSVVATFTCRSGAIGNLEITTSARPDDFEASLSIVGSKGLVQLGGIAVNELQVFTPDPAECERHSEDFAMSVYGNGHEKMYRDIVATRASGEPYPVAYEDCMRSLKLLHAFYRSDELNNWVPADSDEESTRLGRVNEAISDLYRIQRPAMSQS
jgi:UDP-N-acetyl-2-amino-2-deoxyglucuronate dehydrogenase